MGLVNECAICLAHSHGEREAAAMLWFRIYLYHAMVHVDQPLADCKAYAYTLVAVIPLALRRQVEILCELLNLVLLHTLATIHYINFK